jgi:hypothetical protein
MSVIALFPLLFSLVPLIIFIIILVWINTIKVNSDRQIQQNELIIGLLREMNSNINHY